MGKESEKALGKKIDALGSNLLLHMAKEEPIVEGLKIEIAHIRKDTKEMHEKIVHVIEAGTKKVPLSVFYAFVGVSVTILAGMTSVFMDHRAKDFQSQLHVQHEIDTLPSRVTTEIMDKFDLIK